MAYSADAIRNVALVGHRGGGKTSLHEALLFEAGVLGRLGSVTDGTTASDTEADEQARQMSISMTLSSFEWSERKINLLDTPGEPSFVADALGALRVCESAIFVINGVMGAEVTTRRLWKVAAEHDIARMLFVNMLDRERADFYRVLETLKAGYKKTLVVDDKGNENLRLSIRNMDKNQFLPPEGVNVYDLLRHDHLVLSKGAVKALEARCLERKS